jgi:transcriptional regulator with XRE-family HTH domain
MIKYTIIKGIEWPRGSQARIAKLLFMTPQNFAHYLTGNTLADEEMRDRICEAATKCGASISYLIPSGQKIDRLDGYMTKVTDRHYAALAKNRAKNAAKHRWSILKGTGWTVGDGVRLANALNWGKGRVYSYIKNGSKATDEVKDLIVAAAKDCGVDIKAELNEKQQEQK